MFDNEMTWNSKLKLFCKLLNNLLGFGNILSKVIIFEINWSRGANVLGGKQPGGGANAQGGECPRGAEKGMGMQILFIFGIGYAFFWAAAGKAPRNHFY